MPIRPPVRYLSPLVFERDQLVHAVRQTIAHTFAAADAGCVGKPGEVDRLVYFFLEGLPLIEEQFNRILYQYSIRATLSGIFCHQTPKVVPDPHPTKGSGASCELGDMLFLVTYGRRLYGDFLGNALLVQAKEDSVSIRGSLQEFLYQSADGFTYRNPKLLVGQSRTLHECARSLWYWDFNGVHWWPGPGPRIQTAGIAPRHPTPVRRGWPFEAALVDLMCGVAGRRVRILNSNSPEIGWSKIVDDVIRTTARSAFKRQNAYVSRNKEPLRGEDAVRAVATVLGPNHPFLVRSSLERLFSIFDEELAELGESIERLGQNFDEANFRQHLHKIAGPEKPDGEGPPLLGNARPSAGDDDDGGCSFVILDFSG